MGYINQNQYYTNGVNPTDANWGSYQYISLDDIVNNFLVDVCWKPLIINNENQI